MVNQCSSSCGYTAEGCANPAGWSASVISTTATTTSCSKSMNIVATSIVTLTSTIQRPKLDIGRIGLMAAEMQTTVDGESCTFFQFFANTLLT